MDPWVDHRVAIQILVACVVWLPLAVFGNRWEGA